MGYIKEIAKTVYDIGRGVNAKVWGGIEGAEKVSKIVKTGTSGADIIIGVSHATEDLACKDYVCATLDILGSVSSSVGMVLGNLPATKSFTVITGSVTVCCRCVRFYCKRYGTVWGCAVIAGEGIKKGAKFIIENKK